MDKSVHIVAYKAPTRIRKKIENYSKNLKASQAKLINYGLYELFMKSPHKSTPEHIASYISSKSFKMKKDNYTLRITEEYYKKILLMKKEVEAINKEEYFDNEFLGFLLCYYFDKIAFYEKKKVNDKLKTQGNPTQVGLYFNKKLKEKINDVSFRFQINAGMLVFDILTDPALGQLPFKGVPNNIVITDEEKERIIVYMPKYLHEELNQLPLANSFVAEVRGERYMSKYKL
ncbi:hypothetical protein ACU3L3_14465 [Priestia endophytica]